jgi:hypothetical protein
MVYSILCLILTLICYYAAYFLFSYVETSWLYRCAYIFLCLIGNILFLYSAIISKTISQRLSFIIFTVYDCALFLGFTYLGLKLFLKHNQEEITMAMWVFGFACLLIIACFIRLLITYDEY